MTATLTDTTVRSGLARLLDWLTRHPGLPVAFINYADDTGAELCSPAGQFDALIGAAATAEALTHATIEVTDPPLKRITYITIRGTVADFYGAPLEITVEGSVYDAARGALLASLGAPSIPDQRTWQVTAKHLRDLAPAGVR